MKIRNYLIILFLIGFYNLGFSQESLDLNSAISLAVKNNYSILLAKDSLSIARNNNTYGNAGAYPAVTLNGAYTFSDNNIQQNFTTSSNSSNGAKTNNYTSNIALNWNLFNGLKPFATKGRLNQLMHQGELNVKLQIEGTIQQVMKAYYRLITAEQSLKVIKETISIDDERIKIADTKFKIGSGSKIDLLQAKVDRNEQESQLLAQQISIDSAKTFLNQVLVRDLKTSFKTADTDIEIHYKPSWEGLWDSVEQKNFQVLSAKTNILINEFTSRERKADLYPVLQGIAGYYFSETKNTAGFSLLNRSIGPQLGLNLSWNLFNGGFYRIRYENSKLLTNRAKINYNSTLSLIQANLYAQFQAYQNLLTALNLEEENVLLARENFNIALKKYRLGASTQLDLITAVQSLESSLNRLVQAKFNAKISEINLLQLSGNLVH